MKVFFDTTGLTEWDIWCTFGVVGQGRQKSEIHDCFEVTPMMDQNNVKDCVCVYFFWVDAFNNIFHRIHVCFFENVLSFMNGPPPGEIQIFSCAIFPQGSMRISFGWRRAQWLIFHCPWAKLDSLLWANTPWTQKQKFLAKCYSNPFQLLLTHPKWEDQSSSQFLKEDALDNKSTKSHFLVYVSFGEINGVSVFRKCWVYFVAIGISIEKNIAYIHVYGFDTEHASFDPWLDVLSEKNMSFLWLCVVFKSIPKTGTYFPLTRDEYFTRLERTRNLGFKFLFGLFILWLWWCVNVSEDGGFKIRFFGEVNEDMVYDFMHCWLLWSESWGFFLLYFPNLWSFRHLFRSGHKDVFRAGFRVFERTIPATS